MHHSHLVQQNLSALQSNQNFGPGQNFEVNQFSTKTGQEFAQNQQVEDVSFDLSRKESFVANVSRRYQDFNDEESFEAQTENAQKHSKQTFNGNVLDMHAKPTNPYMITPQKNFAGDSGNYADGDLSPISHNNNQSRITIQSYMISHDGKDHQRYFPEPKTSHSKPNGVRRSSSWNNNLKHPANSSKFINTEHPDPIRFMDRENFGNKLQQPKGISPRQTSSDNANLLFDTNFRILDSAADGDLPKISLGDSIEKTVTSKMLYREYK